MLGATESKEVKKSLSETRSTHTLFDLQHTLQALQDKTLTTLDLSASKASDSKKEPTLATTLSGHSDWVSALAVLPDGRMISGSGDKTLKLWDLKSQRCVATLTGHSEAVVALAPLPDGRLVSGSYDKTLKLWDLKSQRCVATLTGHSGAVYAPVLLSDGRVMSAGDSTLKLWDLNSQRCVATLTGHSGAVTALALLPDGRMISGAGDKTLKLWDLKSQRCVATLIGHNNTVVALALLPDGRVISGSDDKTLKLWDLKSQSCVATLTGHSSPVKALVVLPDGRVVSGSVDSTLKLWDLKSQSCVATLSGHSSGVATLAVLSDGRVVSGSSDKTLKLWTNLVPTLHSLTTADVAPLLGGLFINRSVIYLNLQQVALDEKVIPLLGGVISTHPTLKHVDLRQTGLSAEAIKPLYTAAHQRTPSIKLQHESMPYHQLDFARYSQMAHEKPEDKEACQRLLEISRTAHLSVLTQFNFILEHPEALTEKALREMFGNVCHVADIKFPYTLLNMGMKANSFTSAQRELLKIIFLETLSNVAKLSIVNTPCAVAFKLVLKSALRKKLITYPQYLELDREAEKCDTFADNRFKELRQQLTDLQVQINDIRQNVSHLKTAVGVLKENVHVLATDLNQLKTALKRKAERDVYFGVAKTALSFIGGGFVDLLQGSCDLSDFGELSSTLFNIEPDTMAAILKSGEKLNALFQEHREMILDKFGETGTKMLGLNPDDFIEKWSETGLLLQQLPLSTIPEEKKAEESDSASAQLKAESKTENSPSTPLSVAVPVIKDTPEIQKFKDALIRLIKHEDGGFTFQLKRLRFDCLQLQFTAADSILMSAEDIKKELIAVAKSFKEAVASLDIKPAQYKTELNWKEWLFTITADTTVLTPIGGLLHQAGAAFFQAAPQAKAVLFAPAAGKSQTSAQVESKDTQPAVACILQ